MRVLEVEQEWRPEPIRRRTKVLVTIAVVTILVFLLIVAVVVPPRTVARIATVTAPYAQIIGLLGGIAVIITYVRKMVLAGVRATHEAAAENAAAAASQAAASRKTDDAVEALRRQLADTQSARTYEADRNDKVFTALLESQASTRELAKWVAKQNLPERVRQLENFAADRETEEHITGRLRLHEVAPLTHEQDHT